VTDTVSLTGEGRVNLKATPVMICKLQVQRRLVNKEKEEEAEGFQSIFIACPLAHIQTRPQLDSPLPYAVPNDKHVIYLY
jgi:hypothetical protein